MPWCRCRSIRPGAARAVSIRRTTSRAISGCRSCPRSAAFAPTTTANGPRPRRSVTATSRGAFASHARCAGPSRRDRRAGGRCETTGATLDACARASERRAAMREVRALTRRASWGDRDRLNNVRRRRSARRRRSSSFERSPSSVTHAGVASPGGGSSRARAPASPDRARSDRGRPTLRFTAVSGRDVEQDRQRRRRQELLHLREPQRHRAPAPRRTRCSTRCTDRRRGSARRRASAADRASARSDWRCRAAASHRGRSRARPAARARSPRRSTSRSRGTRRAAPCALSSFRRSRSSSACVCLPL